VTDPDRIKLEITAEAEQLRRELRKAAGEVKAFGSEVEQTGKRTQRSADDNEASRRAMGSSRRPSAKRIRRSRFNRNLISR
jgi:hypothetical protein